MTFNGRDAVATLCLTKRRKPSIFRWTLGVGRIRNLSCVSYMRNSITCPGLRGQEENLGFERSHVNDSKHLM